MALLPIQFCKITGKILLTVARLSLHEKNTKVISVMINISEKEQKKITNKSSTDSGCRILNKIEQPLSLILREILVGLLGTTEKISFRGITSKGLASYYRVETSSEESYDKL